jgi:hypothetical protein
VSRDLTGLVIIYAAMAFAVAGYGFVAFKIVF